MDPNSGRIWKIKTIGKKLDYFECFFESCPAKLKLVRESNNKIEYDGAHQETLTTAENEIRILKFEALLRQMATDHANDGVENAKLYQMVLNQNQNMTLSKGHKAKCLRLITYERNKRKMDNARKNTPVPSNPTAASVDIQQQQQPISTLQVVRDLITAI